MINFYDGRSLGSVMQKAVYDRRNTRIDYDGAYAMSIFDGQESLVTHSTKDVDPIRSLRWACQQIVNIQNVRDYMDVVSYFQHNEHGATTYRFPYLKAQMRFYVSTDNTACVVLNASERIKIEDLSGMATFAGLLLKSVALDVAPSYREAPVPTSIGIVAPWLAMSPAAASELSDGQFGSMRVPEFNDPLVGLIGLKKALEGKDVKDTCPLFEALKENR